MIIASRFPARGLVRALHRSLAAIPLLLVPPALAQPASETRVAIVFSGGHETDPRDHGRPVALIAAGLGVPPEVFRDAFSHVRPADPRSGPTGAEAQSNKAALLGRLAKFGVTNERLDAISDHYRYVPGGKDLWPHQPAEAVAIIKRGVVVACELTRGGAGYTTSPKATVPGFESANVAVRVGFASDLARNGAVVSCEILPARAPGKR